MMTQSLAYDVDAIGGTGGLGGNGGRKLLCILDGEKWRPTSYDEILRLTQ